MPQNECLKSKFYSVHWKDLMASGLYSETIRGSGIRSLAPDEIPKLLGWNPPQVESALVFPYPGKDGFFRMKVYPPYKDQDGHLVKYLQPKRQGPYLYIPPGTKEALEDPSIPLILTEGEKKCLKGSQEGFLTIGLGGVWNFLKDGQPIRDLDEIQWQGRHVYIIFDSDALEKTEVLKAEHRLAEELKSRGAIVKSVRLPSEDGQKVGLDDFLVAHGPEALRKLMDEAIEVEDEPEITYAKELIMKGSKRKQVVEAIANIPSAIERGKVIASYSKLTKIPKSDIRTDIQSFLHTTTSVEEERGGEQYKALFPGLVDIVELDGQPAFLVKGDDGLKVLSRYHEEEQTYLPPPRDKIPWLLSRAAEVLRYYKGDNDRQLYEDLIHFFKTTVSELPYPELYDLLIIWLFHTYLIEKFQYSPYLWFYAVPVRGKSRTGKALIWAAYRGVRVESLREAYLLRVGQDFSASVFFDTKDLWTKAEKAASEDIILNRWERGMKVPRVLFPEKGPFKDTVYYDIFGASVVATNETIDEIMETRCIQIIMPLSDKQFDTDITPELILPFKERLTASRARHIGKALPDIKKPISMRLGDGARTFLQTLLVTYPEKEASFIQLLKRIESESLEAKEESFEVKLLLAIESLWEEINEGRLQVVRIMEKVNEGVPEKWQRGEISVGMKLKAMGFEKGTRIDKKSTILVRPDKFEKIYAKYLGKPSEKSVKSVQFDKTRTDKASDEQTKNEQNNNPVKSVQDEKQVCSNKPRTGVNETDLTDLTDFSKDAEGSFARKFSDDEKDPWDSNSPDKCLTPCSDYSMSFHPLAKRPARFCKRKGTFCVFWDSENPCTAPADRE